MTSTLTMSPSEQRAERRAAAELAVLCIYDLHRGLRGHDYGNGQRKGELNRRERALRGDAVTLAYAAAGVQLPESMLRDAGVPLTAAELVAAFDRVGRPRRDRISRRETYRAGTNGGRRSLRAWQDVQTFIDRAEAEELAR